ncbi:MAG: nucleoside deaminase [Crocinitomicaceae bacterium]|nr:nucleoside deaminase [Crocinitomicaceae bacterium]
MERSDEEYMKMAIREAMYAMDQDEVPIGCVVVCKDQVIARGHNLVERLHDFTAHAEMQAFTSASEFLGGKSLDECTLYVTLEPCVMCAGAAYNTRIGRIVFGASDEKRGFTKFGVHSINHQGILHPKTEIKSGVLEEECATLLREFFVSKRHRE